MNEYLKAQSKTNNTVISGAFTEDELERFSKADFRWAENRKKQFQFRPVKKGGKSTNLNSEKTISLKCPMSIGDLYLE